MKQKTLTQAIVIVALLVTTIALQAQVTIGSDQTPNKGALLDLTEGATTTKGLGMPRVELTKLKPTTPAELSASIGGTGNWTLDDHTALAVYNTKADRCAAEPIYEGLYVFDGTEWQFLGKKPEASPDVYTVTDLRDNEVYLARNFGDAGDWMLENLRYIPNSVDYTHTAVSSLTDKYWCYPWRGTSTNLTPYNAVTARNEWDSRAGILYNWAGATNGESPSATDQGQIPGSTPGPGEVENFSGNIQGVCPADWHLPSDREWNELEKEIYENTIKYSKYTISDTFIPTSWNSTWESGASDWRGSSSTNGHGMALISECNLPDNFYGNNTNIGKSLSSQQGGFNAILAGKAEDGNVISYGSGAFFWSASSWDTLAYYRMLNTVPTTWRAFDNRHNLFSVRCKKN